MEQSVRIVELLILFSPVIAWSILVFYLSKWEKKYKNKTIKELEEINFFKKKTRVDLLLWLSGIVATIFFVLLWSILFM